MTGFRGCGKYGSEEATQTAKRVLAGTHVGVSCPYRQPICWHLEAKPRDRHEAPQRSQGLRPRSKKMAKVYREVRVPMVVEVVGQPCGIRWDENCRVHAEGLHEVLSRGRGGSITDPANCIPACHYCNGAVSDNPTEAENRGFLKRSGRPSKAVPR